jgi:long-chain acyl-CoA synthetase
LAPDRIETVYAKCGLISEMFLHGNSYQPYAIAIVVPNREELLQQAAAKGIQGNFEELCDSNIVKRFILREMNAIGRKEGLYGFELAKNIYLESKGFMGKGILTSTMKLIRFDARQVYS